MPKVSVDEEGFVLNEDGTRLELNGEPVSFAEKMLTQKQFDKALGERLAAKNTQITSLEKQANRTPELEQMLEAAKREKSEIEAQLKDAEAQAAAKVEAKLANLTKERDTFKASLLNEQKARVADQVTNSILGAAKDAFHNPARDVVPALLGAHKREPAKDAAGKDIEGQFVDSFKMKFKDDKGAETEEYVPLEKAVGIFAADPGNAHYVRPSGRSGSGGGQYGGANTPQKGTLSYNS